MTAARLNWAYMKKLYEGNGICNVYMLAYKRMEREHKLPSGNLRLPFWLDTLLNKRRQLREQSKLVKFKMNEEGNAEVLRYIAMRAEIKEMWRIKQGYTDVFKTILQNQNAGKRA
jgi:hypothetical protein